MKSEVDFWVQRSNELQTKLAMQLICITPAHTIKCGDNTRVYAIDKASGGPKFWTN